MYVNMFVVIPSRLLLANWVDSHTNRELLTRQETIVGRNIHRDITGRTLGVPSYGPSRPDPILPGLTHNLAEIELIPEIDKIRECTDPVLWSVNADNAPRQTGRIRLCDVAIDEDSSEEE